MDEQLIIFLSTIYGEAAQSSPAAWRAIASVIMNRVGQHEWRKYKTPLLVIANTGFDAFAQQNQPYRDAHRYFTAGMKPALPRLDKLAAHVLGIYYGDDPRVTDAVLYYSPKAQAKLCELKPDIYKRLVPHWAESPLVEEVHIPGTEGDDFAWFRYKA